MAHFFRNLGLVVAACGCLVMAAQTPAQAGNRLDRIMETKVLRVGTPGDYRPFSYRNGETHEGFDIDLANQLAKECGLTVEFVPTSWPNLQKDLEADKFDLAVGGITRTTKRMTVGDFLPPYAPFGKVALMRKEHKDRFISLDSLNQPDVRVIKNPGGTNEAFVLANLPQAQVATHPKNAEIPGLIAEGKGDIMITENAEAMLYAKRDPRLHAGFLDAPLTPTNYMGFWMQKDDPDFARVMNFAWDLLERRGEVNKLTDKWLK